MNPYESPKTQTTTDNARPNRFFLTSIRVRLIGFLLCLFGLLIKGPEGSTTRMVTAGMFLSGVVAITICHWFPNPGRKYSWRKRE